MYIKINPATIDATNLASPIYNFFIVSSQKSIHLESMFQPLRTNIYASTADYKKKTLQSGPFVSANE